MKTVKLYDEMAEKFGDTWKLDVRSPKEAFRAIAANRPEFLKYICEQAEKGTLYEVTAGDFPVGEQHFDGPFSDNEVLHITPVIAGSKSSGLSILLGAAFIAASFIPGLNTAIWAGASSTWASVAFSVGSNLLLGGLAQALAPNPAAPTDGFSASDARPGYYFNGPVQNTALGSVVPVGYGRMLIGVQPISQGMVVEDLI